MNCFNHTDRAAVGTCKACCKGLCSECAADLGHGLSCRGNHEKRVEELEKLISRNVLVQDTARGAKYVTPVFLLFMGAVFTIYGWLYAKTGKFVVILGMGFLVYGAYVLVVNRRAFGRADPMANTSLERTRER